MIITIDGPAGTGKTTIAKKVAENLGFFYFDTGAMYRAITYKILKEKIDLSDKSVMKNFLTTFQFTLKKEKQAVRYFVENEDVTEQIRSLEVTRNVSEIAALGEVREALMAVQRNFAESGSAVFEGRDMGTVVFPQAEFKIFLTARPAVRAERRYLEIKDKIAGATFDEVLREILERDNYDTTREISPLKQAEDAHLIDTSDLTIEAIVEQILSLIRR